LVAITLLPALGMHLIGTVTRVSSVVAVGYAFAIGYGLVFLFWPGAALPAVCEGNYVIFKIEHGWVSWIYEFYYLFFVLLAMLELVLRLAFRTQAKQRNFSKGLISLTLLGYLSFTVPMAVVGIVDASLTKAAPSIMCGFALMFALVLASSIVPRYAREALTIDSRR
jgi:hypothetical protein